MTSELQVLQLIGNLKIGGAQEVVRTLVEYLAYRHCVSIVCTFQDGPLRQEIERLGIKVEVLPNRRYSIVAFPLFVADMIRILRSLTVLVKEYDIDVVQTHLLGSLDFLVLLLRYTTRVRVILWTFHNSNFVLKEIYLPGYRWLLAPKRFAHNHLYRLASRLVSGFIAVSDDVKKSMVDIIGPIQDKIFVICNGVDVKRYGRPVDRVRMRNQLGLEDNACLIAVVARLGEAKGHRYMVEAMAAIASQYRDVHALFIGDGELKGELRSQVDRLGLEGRVHFLGNRHDVPELLAASDLFVLPSLWEGLSMALLEAMATGLPVVASEVSGTVQVIVPNQSGILVPPGDAQQLALAIEQLLADSLWARTLGAAAKRRAAEGFSAQKQADQHLALYYGLLDRQYSILSAMEGGK